jgi:hypothetical protein
MAQPYYRAITISIHRLLRIFQLSFYGLLNELLILFLAYFASRGRALSSVRIGARSDKKFRRN